jgi:hypothetical protein
MTYGWESPFLFRRESVKALVPCRLFSKRLPFKNLLPVGGKPLFIRAVDAAIESGLFERVIVSTDEGYVDMLKEAYRRYSPCPSDLVEFTRPSDGSGEATTAEMTIEVGGCCCIYPAAGQHRSLKAILQTSHRVFRTLSPTALWVGEGLVYWADIDELRAWGDWNIPGRMLLPQVNHVDINVESDYRKVLCHAK